MPDLFFYPLEYLTQRMFFAVIKQFISITTKITYVVTRFRIKLGT